MPKNNFNEAHLEIQKEEILKVRTKKVMIFLLPLFTVAMVLFLRTKANAGVYDDAYTYYHTFASQNLMQAKDGYIYIGNRGSQGASTSAYLFNARGHRFTLTVGGESYYIDIKRGLYGGIYDQNISDIATGGYVYNLYRISYQTICQLLQYNYPNSNLSTLYDQSSTVRFTYDSIMTIKTRQKNKTYTLGGDISFDHWGRPGTWGSLYYTRAAMIAAWKKVTRQTKDFVGFYELSLVIPGSEKEEFVRTTTIQVEEKKGVIKRGNNYFVKAGLPVNYSFRAISSFASGTFQPNYMFLDIKDAKSNAFLSTLTYGFAAPNQNSGVIYNPIPELFSLTQGYFARSEGNCILDYTGVAVIPQDGKWFVIYPRCAIFVNNICQAVSKLGQESQSVSVISDGKGPEIFVEFSANKTLVIQAIDNGSGVDKIEVYSPIGVCLMTSNLTKLELPITEAGSYSIKGWDQVGNMTEISYEVNELDIHPELSVRRIRFISLDFLKVKEEEGGLWEDSCWKVDEEKSWVLEEILGRYGHPETYEEEYQWKMD